jgi:SAM-dependent methyltransferase
MAGRARRLVHDAFEKLPDNVREGARRTRDDLIGLGQLKANQALLAKRLADLEQKVDPQPVAREPEDARFPAGVRTRLCTSAQLEEPWFREWCDAMGEPPHAHRKQWEFTYIAKVMDAMGLLEPGRRGVGFGVGREPLVSAFAARGVEVLATDLEPEDKEAQGWIRSAQHAVGGVEGMLREDVADAEAFRRLVTWRPVDMRAIPDDIQGYDFCWSACSLEHLGSLDLGWEFVEKSLRTLRPGGIAVHTTEFNVESDDVTIESGPTVIYRKKDVLALRDRLEGAGHEVAAVDFDKGQGLLDRYVDVPPYSDEPVLRFWYASFTLTSVAVVVRKAG